MGFLLLASGKLSEAEPYLREALDLRRQLLRSRHPSTLSSMNNLGRLLREKGQLREAEVLGAEAARGASRLHWQTSRTTSLASGCDGRCGNAVWHRGARHGYLRRDG